MYTSGSVVTIDPTTIVRDNTELEIVPANSKDNASHNNHHTQDWKAETIAVFSGLYLCGVLSIIRIRLVICDIVSKLACSQHHEASDKLLHLVHIFALGFGERIRALLHPHTRTSRLVNKRASRP